jgi:hypothetical protein
MLNEVSGQFHRTIVPQSIAPWTIPPDNHAQILHFVMTKHHKSTHVGNVHIPSCALLGRQNPQTFKGGPLIWCWRSMHLGRKVPSLLLASNQEYKWGPTPLPTPTSVYVLNLHISLGIFLHISLGQL